MTDQETINRLAVDVETARRNWHRTREERDMAWRHAQEAVRDEIIAAEAFAAAVAAYEAGKTW